MTKRATAILLFPFLVALATVLQPQPSSAQTISAGEVKNHIGETATVCGKVVSTHYAFRTRGQPTFLNLDKPYPDQIFTVVIWGSDRPKFGHGFFGVCGFLEAPESAGNTTPLTDQFRIYKLLI